MATPIKQLLLCIKKCSKTFYFCFSMAYHDYHHTMSRSRSPIKCNAQPDSPDCNIHGYSQNFENYDFYDPSGYQDYADPHAQSGHNVHGHYDYRHSYAQYSEPKYSSDRRDFYGYQHYEQQHGGFDFHHDVPGGFSAEMQPNRQAGNMAPFNHDVHWTQNLIKIERDENKTVPEPDSRLKTPPKPTRITTIKEEVEVVEILSSNEKNVKEDSPKHADSQTLDSKPADSNGASKKMFPLFAKRI